LLLFLGAKVNGLRGALADSKHKALLPSRLGKNTSIGAAFRAFSAWKAHQCW